MHPHLVSISSPGFATAAVHAPDSRMTFFLYLILIGILIGMGLAVEQLLNRIIQQLEAIEQRLASLDGKGPGG